MILHIDFSQGCFEAGVLCQAQGEHPLQPDGPCHKVSCHFSIFEWQMAVVAVNLIVVVDCYFLLLLSIVD